jgi:hypothetical protein
MGEKGLMPLFPVTRSGMTTEEFAESARKWIATAQQSRFHVPYTKAVYQPMLELLKHLRANGFKTYIVSGRRCWVYESFRRTHLWNTSGAGAGHDVHDGLQQQGREGDADADDAKDLFFDDGPTKPVNIDRTIGKKPIAAFGNSDGDLQMLEWTASNSGPNLELYVHHTDGEREYLYTPKSLGKLEKGLAEANERHWTVVDMKTEWKTIFPPECTIESVR